MKGGDVLEDRENTVEWKLVIATAARAQYLTLGSSRYKDQESPYRNKGLAESLAQKTYYVLSLQYICALLIHLL